MKPPRSSSLKMGAARPPTSMRSRLVTRCVRTVGGGGSLGAMDANVEARVRRLSPASAATSISTSRSSSSTSGGASSWSWKAMSTRCGCRRQRSIAPSRTTSRAREPATITTEAGKPFKPRRPSRPSRSSRSTAISTSNLGTEARSERATATSSPGVPKYNTRCVAPTNGSCPSLSARGFTRSRMSRGVRPVNAPRSAVTRVMRPRAQPHSRAGFRDHARASPAPRRSDRSERACGARSR